MSNTGTIQLEKKPNRRAKMPQARKNIVMLNDL
jgi:hypothetical protein